MARAIAEPSKFTTRVVVAAGTPADAAGLRDGDEVLSVDGTKVATFDELRHVVEERAAPGGSMSLGVRRADGSIDPLTVTLDERRLLGIRASTPIPTSFSRAVLSGLHRVQGRLRRG